MPTENKQTRKFSCVIECYSKIPEGRKIDNYDVLKESLQDMQIILPSSYWAIIHDMDYDEETGELERKHIHLVLETKTRHTCLGVVRLLGEAFGISQTRVSVRTTRNEYSCIRYLMHMDNPEKQPYLPFDVVTNDQEGLNVAILNASALELQIEDLIKVISESRNEMEVAQKIGLKNYQRYRGTIKDIAGICGGSKVKKLKENNIL